MHARPSVCARSLSGALSLSPALSRSLSLYLSRSLSLSLAPPPLSLVDGGWSEKGGTGGRQQGLSGLDAWRVPQAFFFVTLQPRVA